MSSLRSIVTDDRKYFQWPIFYYSLQLRNCTIIFFSNGLIQIQVIAFWKIAKTVAWHWPLKGGLVSDILKQFSYYFALWSMYFFILSLKSKKFNELNTANGSEYTVQKLVFMCNVFCKWIRLQNILYFCIFNYARGDKQKVWSKAENREQDWGETLRTVSVFFSPLTRLTGVWGLHILHVWDG